MFLCSTSTARKPTARSRSVWNKSGRGVSLIGEELLFEPLRRLVAERVFKPFAGLTDIVQAALGEEVVVHGAIALARRRLPERPSTGL